MATKTAKKEDVTQEYVNDIGFITKQDIETRTATANRLEHIAKEHNMDNPEELVNMTMKMLIPKGHDQYVSMRKMVKDTYPQKISTQAGKSKAADLMILFLREMLYGKETQEIKEKMNEKIKAKGTLRPRLEPTEKAIRIATKTVNAAFRAANELQALGAIPKDMKEKHELYVTANVKNIVKSVFQKEENREPTEKEITEMQKEVLKRAI